MTVESKEISADEKLRARVMLQQRLKLRRGGRAKPRCRLCGHSWIAHHRETARTPDGCEYNRCRCEKYMPVER